MRCRPEMMRLYAVTDRAWTKKKSLIEQVEAAICGGATCIQLREKNLDEEAFLREAMEMQKLCETYQVPLIINDHVEIAKQCKAAGVHLGQKDMEAGRAREILGPKRFLECQQGRWNRRCRQSAPEQIISAWEPYFKRVPRPMQKKFPMRY